MHIGTVVYIEATVRCIWRHRSRRLADPRSSEGLDCTDQTMRCRVQMVRWKGGGRGRTLGESMSKQRLTRCAASRTFLRCCGATSSVTSAAQHAVW